MKNKIYILLFILILIFIPGKVNAIGICPAKEINSLKIEAYKVKISYINYKDHNGYTMFHVEVSNLSSKFSIKYNDTFYDGNDDNKIVSINGSFKDNSEYSFDVYSSKALKKCGNAFLVTRTINIPKYNIYSELDECIEYEEAPICQAYYTGDIKDYNDFISLLSTYRDSQQSDVEKYKDDRNIFQIIMDFIQDNIEISVAVISVIVVLIIVFVVVKIRKRIKRAKVRL